VQLIARVVSTVFVESEQAKARAVDECLDWKNVFNHSQVDVEKIHGQKKAIWEELERSVEMLEDANVQLMKSFKYCQDLNAAMKPVVDLLVPEFDEAAAGGEWLEWAQKTSGWMDEYI
jgi:hypothetical protein